MSGGLHILDMIMHHKQNEALRRNINYFKTRKQYTHAARSIGVTYRTATQAERELIRRSVVRQRKQDFVKSIIAFSMALLIVGLLLVPILRFLSGLQ